MGLIQKLKKSIGRSFKKNMNQEIHEKKYEKGSVLYFGEQELLRIDLYENYYSAYWKEEVTLQEFLTSLSQLYLSVYPVFYEAKLRYEDQKESYKAIVFKAKDSEGFEAEKMEMSIEEFLKQNFLIYSENVSFIRIDTPYFSAWGDIKYKPEHKDLTLGIISNQYFPKQLEMFFSNTSKKKLDMKQELVLEKIVSENISRFLERKSE
jgi:hypothetical protein